MSEQQINDGGPAYPMPYHPDQQWENPPGMSLRDYFAGQALAGMLANETSNQASDEEVAITSYNQADAMLTERNRRNAE